MRILVTGGRDYADKDFVFAAMDYLHARRRVTVVIHGVCVRTDKLGRKVGADYFADLCCKKNYLWPRPFPADWDNLGHAAGPHRNAQMLEEGRPDGAVAFPGDRGTADMCRRCSDIGIKVWRPAEDRKFLAWLTEKRKAYA